MADQRRTSQAAYAFAVRSDLISKRRLEVLHFCCHEGQDRPYNNKISRTDVKKFFGDMHDSYCRRLEELAVIGLVQYADEKQDRVSGCMVDCYSVNLSAGLSVITTGLDKLRTANARLTHAAALKRLLNEVEEWVLPQLPASASRRNLEKIMERARLRTPVKVVSIEELKKRKRT